MGNRLSFIQLCFFPIPAPTWTTSDIPDLSGVVAVVTGASGGLGFECVKTLLARNATVYIAARNREKSEAAIQVLSRETGKKAHYIPLDLADLESVRQAAASFQKLERKLHVLINNAGVMVPPVEETTKDNFDLQFGTQVVGHYLFTTLLHAALKEGARSPPVSLPGGSRIVHLTSVAAFEHPTLDFATFVDGPTRRGRGTKDLYRQSKFGTVVLAQEMTRQWADDGIVSLLVHPGVFESDLWRHVDKTGMDYKIFSYFIYPVQYGAITPLYAATSPAAARATGKLLVPWAREHVLPQGVNYDIMGRTLWDWLEKATVANGK